MNALTDQELRDLYTSEACAHLALVLHRATGWPMAILWDNETVDDWGRGSEPTPAHCFVCPPTGENLALDARGLRPVGELRAEFETDMLDPEIDYRVTESELLSLCGPDRPYYSHTQEEHESAEHAAVQLRLLDLARAE